jgi:hypothetical protein
MLAPFLESPAAERRTRHERHAPLSERSRAIAEDCALRALVLSDNLAADPRARELAKHLQILLIRRLGFDAPDVANVPKSALANFAKSWLAKSPNSVHQVPFFAVFLDWHVP